MFYKMFLGFWSLLVRASAPFLINSRLKKGLEYPKRYQERFGITDAIRPKGEVLWFHGASVGESLSILPLIEKISLQKPNAWFLITTTTTAAQKVVSARINHRTIHQFIPFDATNWVKKFLDHWQPKAVFFVESEIWPNILWQTRQRNIPIYLLNARLSQKTLRNWLLIKWISQRLWGCFSGIYTQSDEFTKRFHQLGAVYAKTLGNIKLLSNKLPFDDLEYNHWQKQIGNRPCWVVASTHKGEDQQIFAVHQVLKRDFPNFLTIIAPRHLKICDEIVAQSPSVTIARLSGQTLQDEDVLLVDAMAKLGIFYRLSPIAFIGGSLIPQGGHNPLEPAMIGAFPLWGPHFFNFSDMMYLFEGLPCQQLSVEQLAHSLKDLLTHPEKVVRMVDDLQQRIAASQLKIHQKVDELVGLL